MANTALPQESFKSLLIKQMFIAIAVSMAITIPLVLAPAYFIFSQTINADLQDIEQATHESISTHLRTGWQPANIDKVYQDMRQRLPDAAMFLQKAPTYLDAYDDVVDPATPTTAKFENLIAQVEKDERRIIETNFGNATINAAVPIKFKDQCLVCHSAQVKTGEIYPGALAGTMVLQMPMSFQYFSGTAILSVFVVFLLVFITLATITTNHLVQAKLLNPIEALNQRVKHLRFNSTEKRADWQRTPQKVIEVDQMDASISEHIHSLQHLYDKLDMMVVSEHDSSLFHKDRFNEVLKYQIVMTRRYHNPFTLFIVKLSHIKMVNASAKALEQEKPGTRFSYFGEVLHNETRDTDMTFRLEDQIFALIAPQTDEPGAKVVEHTLKERLTHTQTATPAAGRAITEPVYQFSIQVGHATFNDQGANAKQLLSQAVEAMQQAPSISGEYPPETPPKNT